MNRWLVSPILLCCFTGAALAADMAVLGQYQTVPVAPLYSWTGCYIGVNMGGGAAPQSRVDTLGIFAPPGTSLGDMTARGVVGGGQLGCDYQVGSFVFGLQGLLDLSGMKGSNVLPTTILVNNSFVQTVATFTGRVGYTVLPTLLLYGKFGGAFAHDIYNISVPNGEDVPFFPGTMTVAPATAISSFGGTASLVGWRLAALLRRGPARQRAGQRVSAGNGPLPMLPCRCLWSTITWASAASRCPSHPPSFRGRYFQSISVKRSIPFCSASIFVSGVETGSSRRGAFP